MKTPPAKPTTTVDIEIKEALAFALLVGADNQNLPTHMADWRSQIPTRFLHRDHARAVLTTLQHFGIELRVTKAAKLTSAIDELLTIPATKAYNLEQE